jgi:hypothetical protein
MNPYVTPSLAQAIIADRLASAEAYRRAKAARDGRHGRDGRTSWKTRLSWALPGRRYRRVELRWPDGVCSVVSAPEPPASAGDQARRLAGSRR